MKPFLPIYNFGELLVDIADSPGLIEEDTSLGLPYASYQEQLTALLAPTTHVITTVRDDTTPGTLDLLDVPCWATVYSLDRCFHELYENMDTVFMHGFLCSPVIFS